MLYIEYCDRILMTLTLVKVKLKVKYLFMKNIIKVAGVFMVLLLVTVHVADAAYGGGSRSGGSKRSVPTVNNANLSAGQVLGESTVAFNANLSQGMQSEEVRQLQERLRAEGFFTHPTSTGYFGPITLAAVKAYQTAKGIPFVTGFVGPLTRAELNK